MSFEVPNFTQVPNALFDEHMADMSLAETKCIMAIIRKTKGWHKDADLISLSQLEEATGLSRKTVVKGLELLVDKKLIFRVEKGQSFEYGIAIKTSGKNTLVGKNSTSASGKTTPVSSGKTTPALVEKLHTQKKGLNKTYKEITPPTPPSEDEKLRSASMQLIGREEIVRDTQRLKFESPDFYPKFMDLLNYGGAANYRIKEAKAKQCLVLLESYGEANLIKAADTAILQCGEASRIFGYFAKILQSETPTTQQTQKDVAAARPAINRAEVYERYFDEALDNGMDDANAEVYAARKLQEALNGHSMVS